jgi:opacity protein-like surface antigen
MLKKLLKYFIILIPVSLQSQNLRHELGFIGGVSYYMGDVNPTKLFYSVGPSFGGIYRFDLNSRYALRFSGTHSKVSGSDSKSKNGYQQTRNHSFSSQITEFAGMLEFNFFSYRPETRYEFISPYVTVGIGAALMPVEEGSFPLKTVFPFGIGLKYAINHRLGITAEWTYRKTLTDYLDQLPDDNYSQIPSIDNKQRSYHSSKDWYSFAGISLTYKFALGSIKCPAYRY